MQLLTNVLQRGTLAGGVSAKGGSAAPKPYIELLSAPDLAFALAICESCPPKEVDEVSLLLFRVFETRGTLLGLLKVLVEREVTQTSGPTRITP